MIERNMEFLRNEQKKEVKKIFESVQKQVAGRGEEGQQVVQKYVERVFRTKEEYMARFAKFMSSDRDRKTGNKANTTKPL